uniref:TIL domain-containing protein n=1 Tax=Panagrolaimus sp. ES5 TaxID=591445 RepID=A0AC34FEL9_9BILA
MKFTWSIILLLIFLLATVVMSNEPRRRRHQRRKDNRKIRSAADCGPHEEFTICGPEPQCEQNCDNLFSPPRCHADYTNPRCYYPRCVCKAGYVRDSDGRRCVAEWRCKIQEKLKSHEKHHHRHHASPAAQKLLASKDSKRDYFLFPQPKNNNFW